MDPTEESTLLSVCSKLTFLVQSGGEMKDHKPTTLINFMGAAVSDGLYIPGENGLCLPVQIVLIRDHMASLARTDDDSGFLNDAFAGGAKLPPRTQMNTLAGGRWHPTIHSQILQSYSLSGRCFTRNILIFSMRIV